MVAASPFFFPKTRLLCCGGMGSDSIWQGCVSFVENMVSKNTWVSLALSHTRNRDEVLLVLHPCNRISFLIARVGKAGLTLKIVQILHVLFVLMLIGWLRWIIISPCSPVLPESPIVGLITVHLHQRFVVVPVDRSGRCRDLMQPPIWRGYISQKTYSCVELTIHATGRDIKRSFFLENLALIGLSSESS